MTRIRSQLAGLPSGPTPDDTIRQMAAAAWRTRGICVLWIEGVSDDWLRRALINECNRLYGKSEVAR
jgi:hypothetical protein